MAVAAIVGAVSGYGAQVYNNYQNGYKGSEAWTKNISADPIVGGGLIAPTLVLAAPEVLAVAGYGLATAGTALSISAVYNAGVSTTAASIGTQELLYGPTLPVMEINSKRMPNIANNIENAQANGAPSILTRTTNQNIINTNRNIACLGFCGSGSPDEYPFASTYEGGSNAFVADVPLAEQRIQGGVISSFYHRYGIQDGDKFKVQVR
jgi:hypothetical protein